MLMSDNERLTRRQLFQRVGTVAALVTMGPTLEACAGLSAETKVKSPIKVTYIEGAQMSEQMLTAWGGDTKAEVTRQLKVTVETSGIPKGKEVGFRLIGTKNGDGTREANDVAFAIKPGELSRAMKMTRVVTEDEKGERRYEWLAESREEQKVYYPFMVFALGKREISTDPFVAEKQLDEIVKNQADSAGLSLTITNIFQGGLTIEDRPTLGIAEALAFAFSGNVLAEGVPTVTLKPTDKPSALPTPTFTIVPTSEPTETPVPPTATNVPTKEATKVPTKEQPSPTPTKPETTQVPENGEVLIGEDFIGLSEEDIVKLMALPENEGRIPFPGNADANTTARPIEYLDGTCFIISNIQGDNVDARILYNPSNGKVVRSIVPGKAHFILEDGLTISIFTPKVLSSPENLGAGSLGKELASGLPNQPDPDWVKKRGEYLMTIYKNDPHDGTKFLKIDPRLMYRDRWVCWKP